MGIRTKLNPMGGSSSSKEKYEYQIPCVVNTGSSTFFIDKNKNLWVCGNNQYGQLGTGNTNNVNIFTKVAEGVLKVVNYYDYTMYIDENFDLYYSGGRPDTYIDTSLTFTKKASNVVDVDINSNTSSFYYMYLTKNGDVYQWNMGNNTLGKNICKISCGEYTCFLIDKHNKLYGIGKNQYNTSNDYARKIKNQNVSGAINDATLIAENVRDAGAYNFGSYYITTDDKLFVSGNWGWSSNFQNWYRLVATNVKEASAENGTYWYLDNNDNFYLAGTGSYGEQGNGSTNRVTSLTLRQTNIKFVEKFTNLGYARRIVDNYGVLYITGINDYGQQSNGQQGTYNSGFVTTFTQRASNVAYIPLKSYQYNSSWYIDTEDNLYGCGAGYYGQQGNGSTSNVLTFENKMQYLQG